MKRRVKPNLDPSARVKRQLRLRAKIYASNPLDSQDRMLAMAALEGASAEQWDPW